MSTKQLRVNGAIRVPQVRLIDELGNQHGVVETYRAQQMAREKDLDLVEVSPLAQPPVCRILNYGSYQYQQEKKERKQKSKVKQVEVKGIRLSLNIGPHDLATRRQQSKKFLEKGDRVKLEIRLRGRERAHMARAREVMQQFVDSLNAETPIALDKPISSMGGQLFAVIGKK
ncbi:MAG: translation initiation factor IF-3 [Patescibacteria group bacterium]